MVNRTVDVELVSVDEAGLMTSMSPWSWRKYATTGAVPSVKIGARLLIPKKAILEYIAAHTRPALAGRRLPDSNQ
jgi:hypothetical protein